MKRLDSSANTEDRLTRRKHVWPHRLYWRYFVLIWTAPIVAYASSLAPQSVQDFSGALSVGWFLVGSLISAIPWFRKQIDYGTVMALGCAFPVAIWVILVVVGGCVRAYL